MSSSQRAGQRRLWVLTFGALVWVLGTAALGMVEALNYLAPALLLITLIALGLYPGERVLARKLDRTRPRWRRRPGPLRRKPRLRAVVARGGALLAGGLAGRAPPQPVV